MRLLVLTCMLLFSTLASAQVAAPAFVPENGFWWAPSQPGRGFAIEQQDDELFITVYTYSDESPPSLRAPIWYSAQGSWSPPRSTASNPLYTFDSPLYRSDEGQCIGCPFRDPVTVAADLGLSIRFDSPWSGTMDLGPESIEIERFWFSSSLYDPTNVMLGQWKVVRDYSEADDGAFPFEADVLIFDEKDRRNGTLYAEGYQATTGLPAWGSYDEPDNFYVIVVEEAVDLYLAYYLYGDRFGSDHFTAHAERFEPGAALTFRGFPAEGFRAANRRFVERRVFAAKASVVSSAITASERLTASRPAVIDAALRRKIQAKVDQLVLIGLDAEGQLLAP